MYAADPISSVYGGSVPRLCQRGVEIWRGYVVCALCSRSDRVMCPDRVCAWCGMQFVIVYLQNLLWGVGCTFETHTIQSHLKMPTASGEMCVESKWSVCNNYYIRCCFLTEWGKRSLARLVIISNSRRIDLTVFGSSFWLHKELFGIHKFFI